MAGHRFPQVGAHISNQASFDSHNHGYAKLSGLFEAIDSFEVHRRGKSIYVRRKGKNAKRSVRSEVEP